VSDAFEFLYITDTHIKAQTPASRTDNYLETCIVKLSRVLAYANKRQIGCVVHGGDFFDGRVGFDVWYHVAETVATYPDIHWWVNVGQHDLVAHSHESLRSMPLGAMTFLPNFHILANDQGHHIGNIPIRGTTMPVHLVGRWYSRESRNPEFYHLNWGHAGWAIFTAHGLLVDKPFFGDYVLLEDVPDSNAHIFLASDYHPGWLAIQRGETAYWAPGSLLRPAKPATKRNPVMLHFKLYNNMTHEAENIVVSTEFPFKEEAPALVREHLIDDEMYVGLVDKIDEAKAGLRFADPAELVGQIVADLKIPELVHKKTLELLEEARNVSTR
jgi:hypothetical protein